MLYHDITRTMSNIQFIHIWMTSNPLEYTTMPLNTSKLKECGYGEILAITGVINDNIDSFDQDFRCLPGDNVSIIPVVNKRYMADEYEVSEEVVKKAIKRIVVEQELSYTKANQNTQIPEAFRENRPSEDGDIKVKVDSRAITMKGTLSFEIHRKSFGSSDYVIGF
ncbi:hypothetical protein TNIN_24951 [Trichonephila inaurata madagascariensis]|uniref:Uncharacterized protein n=1 Tax=Trichonephila inaurata madagascariensis TaxID=2747483 RepID=A0A8X6XIB8_9ARAC|nr:hypothetical protein TNIN_24951 [Trichonephila inaurata madagascariensis]